MADRCGTLLVALADLGERRAVVAMDSDEEVLRIEAVHLDQPILVGRGAEDDDEGEVVVPLDLCALPEVLRVLDGERVELEDVPQDLEVRCLRLLDVEPEELPVVEELFDGLAVEVDASGPVRVVDVAEGLRGCFAHRYLCDRRHRR